MCDLVIGIGFWLGLMGYICHSFFSSSVSSLALLSSSISVSIALLSSSIALLSSSIALIFADIDLTFS